MAFTKRAINKAQCFKVDVLTQHFLHVGTIQDGSCCRYAVKICDAVIWHCQRVISSKTVNNIIHDFKLHNMTTLELHNKTDNTQNAAESGLGSKGSSLFTFCSHNLVLDIDADILSLGLTLSRPLVCVHMHILISDVLT